MRALDFRYILILGFFFIFCNAHGTVYPIINNRKSISRSDDVFNSYPESMLHLNKKMMGNVKHFSPYDNYENPKIDVMQSSPFRSVPKVKDFQPNEEIDSIKRTALFRHHNNNPHAVPDKKPKPKPPRVIEIFGQNDVVDITQVAVIGFNVVGLVAMWILIIWWNGWDMLDVAMGDNFNWHSRQLQDAPILSANGPQHEIMSFLSNIINKADYVDLAFTTFGITEKECIDLAICNIRKYLQFTPLVNTLLDNVGLEDMSIFKNYKYAMEIGMNNTSCENMFDLCPNN